MTYFVGVDVGGTTSTVAVGNTDQEVIHITDQFATRAADGPEASVRAIVAQVQTAVQGLEADLNSISAVGLSTPGPATLDGILLKTPNLDPELWDRFPIRKALEDAFREQAPQVAVHYIGDGQAAAMGEFAIRTGRLSWKDRPERQSRDERLTSLFMVIVGTGLGGGEVRDAQVVRGQEGRAGHAGHLFLPPYAFRYEHDRQLVVGNATCTVESAVSLTALTHQLGYRLSLPDWQPHRLNRQSGTLRDKAKQLRDLADEGDELALELFDDQAKALGIALLNLNYVGDFDLLVIGGGVCDLGADVRQRYKRIAEDAYREFALDGFRNLDRFEFSACGDEAPVIGALAHAYATT